jgi:hypothetical protein
VRHPPGPTVALGTPGVVCGADVRVQHAKGRVAKARDGGRRTPRGGEGGKRGGLGEDVVEQAQQMARVGVAAVRGVAEDRGDTVRDLVLGLSLARSKDERVALVPVV